MTVQPKVLPDLTLSSIEDIHLNGWTKCLVLKISLEPNQLMHVSITIIIKTDKNTSHMYSNETHHASKGFIVFSPW